MIDLYTCLCSLSNSSYKGSKGQFLINSLTDITFSENNRVLEISVTKGKDK